MIALDAMGGDFAPEAAVLGALNAAKRGIPVTLFGDQILIEQFLQRHAPNWQTLPLSFVHCTQTIGMGDEPSKSVVKKKDASLVRAVQAVVKGNADAVVSAGNSGAALVAGMLIAGRTRGVLRPAIGHFLPTKTSSVFCVDLGANADCKPEYLEQFACIGHAYVQHVKGIERPRIGLLSNGAEPYKGSQLVKQTYTKLSNSPLNFVGNIEARTIFDDQVDVVVCDGFSGNILLKAVQGTAKAIGHWIKKEGSQASWLQKLGLSFSGSLFSSIKEKTDYARTGGALLLGIQHPLIIAHGCSKAEAIERALVFAHRVAQDKMVEALNSAIIKTINECKDHHANIVQRTLRTVLRIRRT